ncbi:MAG TPA: permease [Pseudolabrys sp.]|nr:permease [Pseudolabrys sp.]
MTRANTLVFLASHELRLGWRDWIALLTAGQRHRLRSVAIVLVLFAVVMHLIAYSVVGAYARLGAVPDKAMLVSLTGTLILSFSLLLSQAMESVTRAFYQRSDLDLILTSPTSPRAVFAIRIGSIAASGAALAMLIASPFVNVLAALGGAHWLLAYFVLAGMGIAATALAVALTVLLFRLLGPQRTRLIAQIVAAVIGAAFVIGLQVAAILSYGSLSRYAPLKSHWLIAHAPDTTSALWLPARAVLGDAQALAAVVGLSVVLLAATILIFAPRFGDHAVAAAGVSEQVVRQRRQRAFRARSPQAALRRKEWMLLKRDPWLMSQTLMQILYLLPPAVLLWRSFSSGTGALIVLVPVLVMAAGQLGGGLAWLSISGEDAPDLVGTAPIGPRAVLLAKIEAVMGAIALIFAPLVLAFAVASPVTALIAAIGTLAAAGAATAIQLFFRVQARRSQFRRRQTSSRIATLLEALSSIAWAGTAALLAAGTWFALAPGLIALGILLAARALSPRAA